MRLDGYMHSDQGAPRRTWMTGAEKREKTLMTSPMPQLPSSPRRV